MGTTIGKAVLVHGAIWRTVPIVAMSLQRSLARAPGLSFGVLMFFVPLPPSSPQSHAICASHPEIGRTILHGAQTSKTLMCVVMVILTASWSFGAVLDLTCGSALSPPVSSSRRPRAR